jgi:preprotein translocase subunit YajC
MMGSLAMLLPFVVIIGLMLLLTRGERKKRSELESKLKKGDHVITRAGLIGKLGEVGDRTVRLEIAPGVTVTLLKSAIESLDTGTAAAAQAGKLDKVDDKKADDKKDKKK